MNTAKIKKTTEQGNSYSSHTKKQSESCEVSPVIYMCVCKW